MCGKEVPRGSVCQNMVRVTCPSKKTTGLRNKCVLSTKFEYCSKFGGAWHIEGPIPGAEILCVGRGYLGGVSVKIWRG